MSNSEQTTKAKQTTEKPKLTPEQREAQRKQALDDAAKKAVSSVTNLRAYLAVQSRFERYSTNNNLLIFAQRPDATRLKSLELWNKEKKWIREGAKAIAIYEPIKKQGKDGKTYTNFVRKNMFDISDIKDPEPDVQPTYTAAEAVQGLFAHKAVDVRMIPDYPSDRQFGAFYDAEENCVYAKRGMGYEQIFTDVAVAWHTRKWQRTSRDTCLRSTNLKRGARRMCWQRNTVFPPRRWRLTVYRRNTA